MPRFASVALALSAALALPARADRCPAPSVGFGPLCVLTRDATLSAPLIVPDNTTLDCQGFALRPTSTGSFAADGTDVLSVPEVGVAVIGGQGVSIRNCTIGDERRPFDLGVVFANSHADSRSPGCASGALNELVHNKIWSRLDPLSILSSDRTVASNNELRWIAGGGDGVQILRDSTGNVIFSNLITSPGTVLVNNEQDRKLPGTATAAGGCADCGVIVADPFFFPLFNLQIGPQLVQLPYVGHGPRNNLIEANEIDLPGDSDGKYHYGIGAAVTSDGTAGIGNIIHEGGTGLGMAGFAQTEFACYPGVCSKDNQRLCINDGDCFIAGIDSKSKGSCSVDVGDESTGNTCANPTVPTDGTVHNTVYEDNELIGPFGNYFDGNGNLVPGGGLLAAGDHNVKPILRNNRMSGTGTEGGIYMACEVLAGAVFENNSITNVANVLLLDDSCAPDVVAGGSFGAKVSGNDFEQVSGEAVLLITESYHYPTELSVDGVGNYWGLTCKEGGFTPAAGPFVCGYDGVTPCQTDSDCVENLGACDLNPNDNGFESCGGNNQFYCLTDAECNPFIFSCASVNPQTDSSSRDVVDSHPFGKPIESASRTCKQLAPRAPADRG